MDCARWLQIERRAGRMRRRGPRPTRGIAGVNTVTVRRDGQITVYRYHRATKVRLTHAAGSAADLQQIQRLDDRVAARHSDRGTLGALITAYRQSVAWSRLAARTQKDYAHVFDWLAELKPMPVAEVNAPFVAGLRDKAVSENGIRLANYIVTCLSLIFEWGREFGLTTDNPARRIRKAKPARTGARLRQNRAWDAASWRAFEEAAPVHVRWPAALARYLGARQGDVVTMTLAQVQGEMAKWTARKNTFEVMVPVVDALATIRSDYLAFRAGLASKLIGRDDEPACLNLRGRPWTESGLRAVFFKLLGKLQREGKAAAGLTFHGLRSTHAMDWAAMGDDRTIGTALGDKTPAMARLYGAEEDKANRLKDALKAAKDRKK
jgi:integrase